MDETDKKIMRMVKECEDNNIEVCQKTLAVLLKKSMQTVNRRIRKLVDDDLLEERAVTRGRARFKLLSIANNKRKTTGWKLDEILRKIGIIMDRLE